MSQIQDKITKTNLRNALKKFTRAKALKAISSENCVEERFTKHANKHVRARAEHLAAKNTAE